MLKKKYIFDKLRRKVNKYHITIFVFVVILSLSDSNPYLRFLYYRQIRELQSEIQSYRQRISENRARLNSLQTDSESLERYAREHYLMTKPDEELYIITP
jgi:cell division protein FtsB